MVLFDITKHSLLLIGGALAGILYVLVIPYVWIVAGIVMLGKRAVGGLVSVAQGNSSFEWRPRQSYFTGRKEKRRGK